MRVSRAMCAIGVGACALVAAAGAEALNLRGVDPVPPKETGKAVPVMPARGLAKIVVAQGSDPLDGGTAANPYYGYDGDGPMVPAPGDTPTPSHQVEATKTEPDKNTYLVLEGEGGPTHGYDYGTHFVFQGHEGGSPGFLSRINLDADGAHRVTLMASHDVHGNPLPEYDGSAWDPFAHRLVLTTEDGSIAGAYEATANYPSRVSDLEQVLGDAAYEGVQVDSKGDLWLVEDSGGAFGTVNDRAKQPNSFVYRFIPRNPRNLDAGGTLQALQVTSNRTGEPVVFHDGQADQDITSPDVRDLHTYGMDFRTRWVTLHDTSTDGFGAFDANALAKQLQATPFKRPENGVFAPATGFSRFVFTETGDTDADSQAGAALGGFGALFELRETGPRANRGHLRMVIRGDELHTGFDNIAFADRTTVLVAEDAGDTLHTQRGRFDSLYAVRTDVNYANGGHHPVRVMYVGRDASATIDSALGDIDGFQNEGDNEVTGIHVSDGNPTIAGLLGVNVPHAFAPGSPWRVFVTAQHGDNVTYELTRSS
jgi:uncharacterized protein DUF839